MLACKNVNGKNIFMEDNMAFLNSFVEYLIVMIVIVAVGFLGGFLGKKFRDSKDKKAESSASNQGE